MAKKIAVLYDKPPVRFSKSGAPYIHVSDIFQSRERQKIISRMAGMQTLKESVGKVLIAKDPSKKK